MSLYYNVLYFVPEQPPCIILVFLVIMCCSFVLLQSYLKKDLHQSYT